MGNPIDIAAKGLAQSQAQLAKSAQRLVESAARGQTGDFDRQVASAAPPEARTPARGQRPSQNTASNRFAGSPLQGQGAYIPSLAEETVQMRIAANTYRANARMIEAADDVLKMTQEMLRSSDADDTEAADQ